MMFTVVIGTIEARGRIWSNTGIFAIIVFGDFFGWFGFFLDVFEFGTKFEDVLFQLKILLFEKTDFVVFLD